MSSSIRRINPVIPSKSKSIPMDLIRINRPWEVNTKTFEIAKYLESGGVIAPILVVEGKTGRYTVRDGHHRFTACKLAGMKNILVVFK